jgi:hypothetical protein
MFTHPSCARNPERPLPLPNRSSEVAAASAACFEPPAALPSPLYAPLGDPVPERCAQPFCFVDASACDVAAHKADMFATHPAVGRSQNLFYSYEACNARDYTTWDGSACPGADLLKRTRSRVVTVPNAGLAFTATAPRLLYHVGFDMLNACMALYALIFLRNLAALRQSGGLFMS